MRTKFRLRSVLAAGALAFAIGIPTAALATGTSQAQGATIINLNPQRIEYGGEVTVTGTASTPAAGQVVQLQFAPRNAAGWSPVGSATTTGNGGFRIHAKLFRSGLVRVVGATKATAAAATAVASTGSSSVQPSASQPVAVAAKLNVPGRSVNVLSGSPADVRGRLLPGVAWRRVVLQARTGGGWHTIAHAFTREGGRFDLHFVPGNLGSEGLRVRFVGDASNRGALVHVGRLTVYRQSVASWYNDGGSTACGFHATMGVANKTLPCGTKVTFLYGGHQVTAVVDDRGPFVAGRDWDLNQNASAALGMGGVATLWSSL
jgi:rare lipoprotein A